MKRLDYMMITGSPEVGRLIEAHGVFRVFMDQEVLGKDERQGHLDTHKAAHSLAQISQMSNVLERAELMVRINPINPQSSTEVNLAIEHGAQRLMLPMFRTVSEVAEFLELVSGRVPVTLLAETPQALARLPDWLALLEPQRDEVHIGLNDLAIGMGLNFLFEPLANRLLDSSAERLNESGIIWGFGGIARAGQGALPAEVILGEHVRLGSQRVILSRAFHQGAESADELMERLDFPEEVAKLKSMETHWRRQSEEELLANHKILAEKALAIGRGLG